MQIVLIIKVLCGTGGECMERMTLQACVSKCAIEVKQPNWCFARHASLLPVLHNSWWPAESLKLSFEKHSAWDFIISMWSHTGIIRGNGDTAVDELLTPTSRDFEMENEDQHIAVYPNDYCIW